MPRKKKVEASAVEAVEVPVENLKIYQVTLTVNEQTQATDGETLLDAFGKLDKHEVFNTLGELRVKKNDREFSMSLTVPKLRNFFNDETFRQIINDHFELALS
jgi:hypothetical protein